MKTQIPAFSVVNKDEYGRNIQDALWLYVNKFT